MIPQPAATVQEVKKVDHLSVPGNVIISDILSGNTLDVVRGTTPNNNNKESNSTAPVTAVL